MRRSPTAPALLQLLGVLCLLLGTSSVACARGPAPPDANAHSFEIVEEVGVTTAISRGEPRFEGEIFRYEKVLEARPDPRHPDSFLGSPGDMAIDEDRTLYVEDARPGHLVVFDSEGEYLRTIGRPGQGPGEFDGSFDIVRLTDEGLWLSGATLRRLQLFRRDGTFVRTVSYPEGTGRGVHHLLDDGRFIVPDRVDDVSEERMAARYRVSVYGPDGAELAAVETSEVKLADYTWAEVGGRRRPIPGIVHFAPWPDGGYASGRGIYLSEPARGTISWYDLEGTPTRRFRLELPREPVTADDRAFLEASWERELEEIENPETRQIGRLRLENATFHDPKAPWRAAVVDDRGFVWLRRHTRRGDDRTYEGMRISFWILGPDGELLGSTTPPSPGEISRGYLLDSTVPNPTEAEHLPTVYRMESAVDGLEYR